VKDAECAKVARNSGMGRKATGRVFGILKSLLIRHALKGMNMGEKYLIKMMLFSLSLHSKIFIPVSEKLLEKYGKGHFFVKAWSEVALLFCGLSKTFALIYLFLYMAKEK